METTIKRPGLQERARQAYAARQAAAAAREREDAAQAALRQRELVTKALDLTLSVEPESFTETGHAVVAGLEFSAWRRENSGGYPSLSLAGKCPRCRMETISAEIHSPADLAPMLDEPFRPWYGHECDLLAEREEAPIALPIPPAPSLDEQLADVLRAIIRAEIREREEERDA